MLPRRILITIDLVVQSLARPRTLAVTAFPFILWFLKRLIWGRTAYRHDLLVLAIVYIFLGAAAFAWEFMKAADILSNEHKLYSELEKLDALEQVELKRLVNAGRINIGPPVFERIAAKTPFIYRDVSGEWRIERNYRRFLQYWTRHFGHR
jgi:signal transduction histidine kinase